jgi:hypothetical protein
LTLGGNDLNWRRFKFIIDISRMERPINLEAGSHVLLHAHMFKNAGTSFDWSLRRSFGDTFIEHHDDDAMRKGAGYLEAFLLDRPNIKALSSHWITFPLPTPPALNCHLAMFFRDPIERMRSVYNFERRQLPAATPGSKKAKELSFLDYMRWQLQPMPGPVVKNFHTRYCSGNYLGEDLDELYELALATVESTPLLGLVHRYDESIVLFEYLLRETFPGLDLAYLRQNSSNETDSTLKQRRQSVLSELAPLQADIIRANEYDLRLYELVVNRFEFALSQVPDVPARLRELARRNAILL